MNTNLTIYCNQNPKGYQLGSCSWHCNDEIWESALRIVSNILGHPIRDTSWNGENYRHYSTNLFKLKPNQFESILKKLSYEGITFSIF